MRGGGRCGIVSREYRREWLAKDPNFYRLKLPSFSSCSFVSLSLTLFFFIFLIIPVTYVQKIATDATRDTRILLSIAVPRSQWRFPRASAVETDKIPHDFSFLTAIFFCFRKISSKFFEHQRDIVYIAAEFPTEIPR